VREHHEKNKVLLVTAVLLSPVYTTAELIQLPVQLYGMFCSYRSWLRPWFCSSAILARSEQRRGPRFQRGHQERNSTCGARGGSQLFGHWTRPLQGNTRTDTHTYARTHARKYPVPKWQPSLFCVNFFLDFDRRLNYKTAGFCFRQQVKNGCRKQKTCQAPCASIRPRILDSDYESRTQLWEDNFILQIIKKAKNNSTLYNAIPSETHGLRHSLIFVHLPFCTCLVLL
jgi:hypothetical protein